MAQSKLEKWSEGPQREREVSKEVKGSLKKRKREVYNGGKGGVRKRGKCVERERNGVRQGEKRV